MTYNRLAKLDLERGEEIYVKTTTGEIVTDFDCYDPIENAVSVVGLDDKVRWFPLVDIKALKRIDDMEFEERNRIMRRIGLDEVTDFDF